MGLLYTSRPYTKEDKKNAVSLLLESALPDRDFYILLLGAIFLAVFGIFLDSIPVLIASMIVAPLAYPILALGLGIVAGDARLMARSAGMLVVSFVAAIALAIFITFVFGHFRVDPVFISFASNRELATAIAVIAGLIASYGLIRSKVGAAMTGVGIAVSLMPPLVATGIGVAASDSALASTGLILFLLNVAGILAGSIVMFFFMGIGREYGSMRPGK